MLNQPAKLQLTLAVSMLFLLSPIQPARAAKPAADKTVAKTVEKKVALKNQPDYEDDYLRIRLIRRSPKQIAAFYEGRQFPAAAIEKVSQVCFIAAIVHNKTRDILWLDLDKWRFQGKQEIKRLDRAYWKQQWSQAKVDKASQATFGWTLLPDQRDLRPDEGVGGNITLPASKQEFTIIAQFDRGADRQLPALTVKLNNVRCKQDDEVK